MPRRRRAWRGRRRAAQGLPWERRCSRRAGRWPQESCDSRLHRGRAPSAATASSAPAPSTTQPTQGCPPPGEKGHQSICVSPRSRVTADWTSSSYLRPGGWMPRGLEGARALPLRILRPCSPGGARPWCRIPQPCTDWLQSGSDSPVSPGVPAAGTGMCCASSAPSSRQDTSGTRTEQALPDPALFKNLRCRNAGKPHLLTPRPQPSPGPAGDGGAGRARSLRGSCAVTPRMLTPGHCHSPEQMSRAASLRLLCSPDSAPQWVGLALNQRPS